jgi:hypothetical protein
MARKRIPPEIEATVLVMSRRRCCVCYGCYGLNRDISIKSGQIAHLDQQPENDALDNLAFMCFEHHDQYDSRTSQSKWLTAREVRHFRKELHEVIEKAWKQPIQIGAAKLREADDISGRYIREGDFESAELQIWVLLNGNVRVTGLALWGKNREYGPNLGELDFEAELEGNKVVFSDRSIGDDEYRLELYFEGEHLIAKENYVVGYFGMNVSFEGEYRRLD